MRLATYNVENLINRAKAMNLGSGLYLACPLFLERVQARIQGRMGNRASALS